MKRLRIAQVAPLWYPVPPKGYGGTELIVSLLTEELVRRGHKVTLYASGDSKTKAKKVSVVATSLTSMHIPWTAPGFNLLNLERAFSDAKKFDVIHTHIDPFDSLFRASSKVPTVATLHNHFWPFQDANTAKFHDRVSMYERFKRLPFVAISDAYRKLCPVKLNFVATIHHGIRTDEFKFNPKPKDHFLWFGRIAAAKGLHNAVKAAHRSKENLLICGPFITKESREYYDKQVCGYVDGAKIRYLKERDRKDVPKLLGDAKALLYPLEWDEPFGLIMAEAMACGTPVIAYHRGSVPELIRDGVTGFIVDSIGAMIGAMKDIDRIDRAECRRHAEKQFSVRHMADKYEEVYAKLIKKR